MLELNKWFFVLVVNFLALLYVLNLILFRPLLRVFKEREDTVNGALGAAKSAEGEKERALEDMKRGIAEASQKAKDAFEALRAEGLAKQKDMISAASAEASGIAGKAKEDLRSEADKARKALRADVEKFSEEIVKRLVGV